MIELCKVASERGICLHLSNGMEELAMGMEDVPGGAVGVGGVLPAEIPADLAGLLNAVNGGGGGLRLGPIGINGGVGVQITAINGVQVGLQVPAPAQPPIPAPVPVVPAVPTAAGIPVDEDDDERRRETLDRPVVFGNDSVFDLD